MDARNADEEMRQMKREVMILHERNIKCMDEVRAHRTLYGARGCYKSAR